MSRLQDAVPGDPQRAWQRRPNSVFINPLHLAPESTQSVQGHTARRSSKFLYTTAVSQWMESFRIQETGFAPLRAIARQSCRIAETETMAPTKFIRTLRDIVNFSRTTKHARA